MEENSSNRTDVFSYEDFNCPFSFALNERLSNLESASVERRLIQHVPNTYIESHNVREQAELANEVFTVRLLASNR